MVRDNHEVGSVQQEMPIGNNSTLGLFPEQERSFDEDPTRQAIIGEGVDEPSPLMFKK